MINNQNSSNNDPEGVMPNEEIFSESFFDTPAWELLKAVKSEMVAAKVNPKDRKQVGKLLEEIEKHNILNFTHSLRVGLLISRIGQMMSGFEKKPLLLSGLIHDYGKVNIDNKILDKVDYNLKDHNIVKKHVLEGYKSLVFSLMFSAEIAARHHQFNGEPYPVQIPKNNKISERQMMKVKYFARLLAFVDFYDAINSRQDCKWGEGKLTPKRKKEILIEQNLDIAEMIEAMYARGLFH